MVAEAREWQEVGAGLESASGRGGLFLQAGGGQGGGQGEGGRVGRAGTMAAQEQ